MTVEAPSPELLSEVLRLCTALADRALDAKIMGRPLPAAQAVALEKAARFLQDHGVEWPPLLTQVLYEPADERDKAALSPDPGAEAPKGVDLSGLTRFFANIRTKDQS